MRKVILILVAISVLAQSVHFSLEDLLNLSTLTEHLSDHLKTGDDLTSFLDYHYGSKASLHKNDHEEHKDLPFKPDQLNLTIQLDYFFYEQQTKLTFCENIPIQDNFNYFEIYSHELIDQLLQPPRA